MKILTALSAFILLAAPALHPRPPSTNPAKKWKPQISITANYLSGAEAAFSSIGVIHYPEDSSGETEYLFHDGYINLTGENTRATSDFGFYMANARHDKDGYVTSFTLNRYRAEPPEQHLTEKADGAYGWETAFRYVFTDDESRWRPGCLAALGFYNLNADYDETLEANLFRQTAEVTLNGPKILYQEGGLYQGGAAGPAIDVDEDMAFDPGSEEKMTQPVWNGEDAPVTASVDNKYEVQALFKTLRLGPTLDWDVFSRLYVQCAAGFMASHVNATYDITETLLDPPKDIFAQYEAEEKAAAEWLWGYYGELGLFFQATRHTRLFASFQYFDIGSLKERTINDVVCKISMDGCFSAGAGVCFQF